MKGVIFFLVVLLAAWMAGAEYVWLCQVKNHCEAVTAADATGLTRADSSASPSGAMPASPENRADQPGDADPLLSETAAASIAAESTATPASAPPAPEVAVTTAGAEPTRQSLALEIDGQTVFTSVPFGFEPDRWQIGSARNGPDIARSLAQLLREKQTIELTIAGQYLNDERTPDSFDNTGQARAQSLFDVLVDAGIARDRLTQRSVLLNNTGVRPNVQPGFILSAVDVSPLLQPRSLFFNTASAAPRSTADLGLYVSEIGQFLAQHRGASVRITGHTDNTGETDGNEALGLGRARQVAELLGTMGLPTTRIRIGSRGQNEPIADNTTAAGRAANRRVEIQLDMGRR